MVHDQNLRRGKWSTGRVAKVYPGADRFVRAVNVNLPSGTFRRGIQHLSLLETVSSVAVEPLEPDSGEDGSAKSIEKSGTTANIVQ